MPKQSAGLLLYRRRDGGVEVFLVHPGGPFWATRDEGAWSIPKGEPSPGEDLLDAARREFEEETSFPASSRDLIALEPVKQPSGKVVHAWALEGDCDPQLLRSNTFEMEWPPHSGRKSSFPEVDRGAWFPAAEARSKIHAGQAPLIADLLNRIGGAE